MALSMFIQEVLWVHAMVEDLGHEQVGATWRWEDNQGAIGLASNGGYSARTKHTDNRLTSSERIWHATSSHSSTIRR